MNRYVQLSSATILSLILSGCVIAIGTDSFEMDKGWKERQERNFDYVQHLDIGRSLASIEADLGEPDFTEAFRRDGEVFEIFYYRTRRLHDDNKTSMDETTPLVFIENELVGWGESAIDKATR